MPLDAPVIYALLRELKPQLEGGRIDRIQMPEKNVLIFSLRCSAAILQISHCLQTLISWIYIPMW